MLMGSKNCWHVIWMMLFLSSISRSVAQSMNNNSYHDPVSLDDFFRGYAYDQVVRLRTGFLYNISLPSNLSGMEVSFIQLRTGNFRRHGANLSYFRIPKGTFPVPYVKRFDLVFQNLGNWSSVYYNVPNYTLITPVVGFMFYNASNPRTIGNSRLDLIVNGDPILIHFPWISLPENTNVTMQCVRFDANGSAQLTNMTLSNACIARKDGHFSIVVPSLPPTTKRKDRLWKCWVMGFGLGIFGFILVSVFGFLTYKFVKRKRIGEMERQSERNEALETTWVGRSKMPSATGIRTQPTIENDFVP